MSGIVILGAGPTGLGAGYRLRERGEDGLRDLRARREARRALDELRGRQGLHLGRVRAHHLLRLSLLQRAAWTSSSARTACAASTGRAGSSSRTATSGIRSRTTSRLSRKKRCSSAWSGSSSRRRSTGTGAYTNFDEWVQARFGAGVSKHFMVPYNLKVWSTPLEKMGFYWIAERVAVVDWKKALEATLRPKVTDWGPNATFGYPATKRDRRPVAGLRPADRGGAHPLPQARRLRGRGKARDHLHRRHDAPLRQAPLDAAARRPGRPARPRAREGPPGLEEPPLQPPLHGGDRPEAPVPVSTKNWIYFPNPKTPFYRMTYLSNYSPDIVPGGDTSRYCSLLTETTYSRFDHLPPGDFVKAVVEGLVAEGILERSDLPYRIEIPDPRRARLPDPQRGPGRGARGDPGLPGAEGDLLAGPLRLLEIRDRKPGPLPDAGKELVDRWLDGTEEKVFKT